MTVLNPTRLADALAALAAQPSAMVLAGGTDAMVEINMMLVVVQFDDLATEVRLE